MFQPPGNATQKNQAYDDIIDEIFRHVITQNVNTRCELLIIIMSLKPSPPPRSAGGTIQKIRF